MLPSPNLSLYRPDHGDWPDTWETPVNANWDIIDAVFSGIRSDLGGTGHIHDGTDGQGPKIDHDDLLNKGTTSHADLDADQGKVLVSSADTVIDYLQEKLAAGANITINLLNPGGDEQLEIVAAALDPSFGDVGDPTGGYGWKSFTTTTSPVVYTDNFNWPLHLTLDNADYRTDNFTPSLVPFLPFSTGYSAIFMANPPGGTDDPIGRYASVVRCQVPHSEPQRATISITDINYAEMVAGDFIAFSLAVFASPTLGPNLPHKYGIILELHLVKLTDGPDTWQFTYRVIVIPDDTTQDQIHEATLSDPEDITGCWEISIDRNGHVYVYYRRTLIYTTQTSPPSATGPLLTYYPTLTASLVANGDPPYGGIGFGCQYDISEESSVSLEVRWFSMAGTDDLFYETPETPPVAEPPLVIEYDDPEFWDEPGPNPPPVPAAPCCPPDKAPGETVSQPGQPLEFVVGCCEWACPECGAVGPGYWTNISGIFGHAGCLPCDMHKPGDPPHDPFDPGDLSPPGDVTEGTTDGRFASHLPGVPTNVVMDSLNAGFHIGWVNWIDDQTLFFQYTVDEEATGVVDVRYWNPHEPTNKATIRISDSILPAPVEITGLSFKDSYYGGVGAANPFTFYTYDVTVSGSGFTAGTVFTADVGTILTTTLVDWNEVTLEIEYDSTGGTETITATKAPFVDSYSADILPQPLDYVSGAITGTSGNGLVATLDVPFITSTTPTVEPFPVGALTITNIAYVLATSVLTFDYNVNAGAGTEVFVDVVDPNTLEEIRISLLKVGGGSNPIITSVLTNVDPFEGRIVNVTVNGTFSFDDYLTLTTLLDGPNGVPGGLLLLSVTSGQMLATVLIDTGGVPGAVDAIVSCPEANITPARTVTFPAAFTTLAVPALSYTSNSGPWAAGTSGTLTVNGGGFTELAGEITIESDNPLVIFTGAITWISAAQFTVPYEVSADADGETVNFTITQTLDGQTAGFAEALGLQAPTIVSVTATEGDYIAPLRVIKVRMIGTNFDVAGGVITGTGWSVTGYTVTSTTEAEVDVTCPGITGLWTLRVTNPDSQYAEDSGTVPNQPDADMFHSESGILISGVQVEWYVYGQYLDPPGLSVPEADSVDTALRTYTQGLITPLGPPGTVVEVTFDSTLGTYGPFELGEITDTPPAPTVTGVGTPFPNEYKNYPLLEIYGTNLSQVDHLYIVLDTGEELKMAIRYWSPPVGLGTDPAPNSIVSKTDVLIKIDVDFAELLAWRYFHISLRDVADAEIGVSADETFWLEPHDNDVPLIDETVVWPQINPNVSANYVMTVPLIQSGTLNLPGDIWTVTNAVINNQNWNGVDSWILDITNAGGPLGDPVELLLERPDPPFSGDPPYAAVIVYPLV